MVAFTTNHISLSRRFLLTFVTTTSHLPFKQQFVPAFVVSRCDYVYRHIRLARHPRRTLFALDGRHRHFPVTMRQSAYIAEIVCRSPSPRTRCLCANEGVSDRAKTE